MLKAWLEALWGLIYPRRCPGCGRATAADSHWCGTCLAAILTPQYIQPQPAIFRALDGCWAATNYTGRIRRLIRDMKFRRTQRQAAALAELVERAAPVSGGGKEGFAVDVVVPVPLHRERYRERGFNQTAAIFRPWCRRRELAWREALLRNRLTLPQWTLGMTARRQNITGAFTAARPEDIQNKNILLVDDICTSGITLEECAKVLKAAGAAQVMGFVLASGAAASPANR
ncbi:MAG TPA: ComF family protein [Patescibacteria group bacterium]|nr:ComF family protein [Patescibacteria group bacterium]